ncbi:hypothetical protein INR76_06010 [Marixanthomonas sp. SCSIO 43207]|uniref:hypothetical protein n=1 Tax=Marixanthomonas sp. SCSIO 43207 TaxID=2779360 RepID=UPI001CA9A0D1|nr:hypothetical protein [Marixanthomonas sp. SCSIO 43207]UAB82312.1 hypothetical protein INR76_06010 [Marixanthomonas sp. SCSIO 43207]
MKTKKIISVTISNSVEYQKDIKTTELTEVNELLENGWDILKQDIVEKEGSAHFSIIYTLEK